MERVFHYYWNTINHEAKGKYLYLNHHHHFNSFMDSHKEASLFNWNLEKIYGWYHCNHNGRLYRSCWQNNFNHFALRPKRTIYTHDGHGATNVGYKRKNSSVQSTCWFKLLWNIKDEIMVLLLLHCFFRSHNVCEECNALLSSDIFITSKWATHIQIRTPCLFSLNAITNGNG